jgi:hypothetical protein
VTRGERASPQAEHRRSSETEPAGERPREDSNGAHPDPERPPLVDKLLRGRERHKRRSKAARVAWVAAGFLVIAGGLAIFPLPGPGPLILVPVGLAMLALEYVWAEKLLERTLVYANRARHGASGLSRRQKVLAVVLALLLVAGTYAGAAALWELPGPLPG